MREFTPLGILNLSLHGIAALLFVFVPAGLCFVNVYFSVLTTPGTLG